VPPEAVSVAVAPVHMMPSLFATPDVSATAIAAVGVVQVPGTVVTAALLVLDILGSELQLQRVSMVCAGPVCA
jgi:hypothetical protein